MRRYVPSVMTKHTLYSSISPKIVIRITTHIKLRAVQQLIIAELAGHRPAWPGNSSTDCPSTLHAGSNRKCLSAELNCKQSPLIKSTCSIKNGAGCHATSDDPCMLQLDGYAKCCCLQFLAAQQHASLAYKRPTCTLTQLNSTMPHTTHSQHLIRCQPDMITADFAAFTDGTQHLTNHAPQMHPALVLLPSYSWLPATHTLMPTLPQPAADHLLLTKPPTSKLLPQHNKPHMPSQPTQQCKALQEARFAKAQRNTMQPAATLAACGQVLHVRPLIRI